MARKSRKNKDINPVNDGMKIYRTAVYARLSRESQKKETIEAQIDIVKAYIENRRVFELVEIYADDGWSGTNFDRPAFQRLMEDLRNGKIDCIIVKDLSRFAREHIGAEDYLNNIFPFLGVRFIAVNDGYDNINIEPQEYFLASFKNLAHAHFAQETSRKVSMAKRALQEQGKFIGSKVAYGYKRDPADKHKLIPDEEAALIVREIFERFANGETSTDITRDLNKRVIPPAPKYKWTEVRVCEILRKEVYIGTLVQRTTMQSFYKNEDMRSVPKEEQIRVENAFPAIISQELWDKVRNATAERMARKHEGIPENPYKNLVFCGKCGRIIKGGYKRCISDFVFNCFKCKSGVYASGKILNNLVRKHLKLSENAEISKEIPANSFAQIVIFDKNNIVLHEKGGESP